MKSLFDLTGKTALITGAARGLGAHYARCLSEAGARVILTDVNFDSLDAFAHELGNACAFKMDIADKSSVLKVFDALADAGEKIDILINNAGIRKNATIFGDDNDDDFEAVLQTNLTGTWYVTKAAANHMKQHNIPGSIINIGSICGDALPTTLKMSYNLSKAAIMHLTKALVGELSPYHIRINAISPGFFVTEGTIDANKNPNWIENIRQSVPLGFMPDQNDLDGVILFLASNEASRFITGSVITVDGGISWRG